MDDTFDVYEFCVEVWQEDGEWNYSVIQKFDDDDPEVLCYGTADTQVDALKEVSDFIPTIDLV